VQRKKGVKSSVIAGASTACRLVAFSATFGYCLLGFFGLSVITIENYTNSEMTDMVLCCGSALRAQALYREKGPRAGATGTGVRPRTPNSRDCGRTPVNKYSAVSSSSKGCNPIVLSGASIATKRFHSPARVLSVDDSKVINLIFCE
jgi:hypothetical protein